MKTVYKFLDSILLNSLVFKMLILLITMITAVPFLHTYVGGYVKILLVYGIIVVAYLLIKGELKNLILKNKNYLLILFCFSYLISIILNRSLNFSANIKALAYMGIFFILLYMNCRENDKLEKQIKWISRAFIICSVVFSLVSFATYMFSISGHYMHNGRFMYYGMYDNRLWGIYNANTGSVINSISILLSLGFIFDGCKKNRVIMHSLNILLQFACLILTMSRAATYVLFLLVLIFVFVIALRKNINEQGSFSFKAIIKPMVVMLASGVIIVLSFVVLKKGISYLPSLVEKIEVQLEGNDAEDVEIKEEELIRLEDVENREGGFFSGRLVIWNACIETWQDNMLFGVTRENVYENAAPKLSSPTWESNLAVGGPHNIYICVLVSSGLVGFLIIAVFLLYKMWNMLKYAVHNIKNINIWFLVSMLIFIFFLIVEFVEARILYQVSLFNVLFWIYFGFVSAYAENKDGGGSDCRSLE